GKGPGELSNVGSVFVLDSMLLVADVGQRRLNVYDRSTGEFLFHRRYEGSLETASWLNGRMWFGAQNIARQTGIAAWDIQSDSFSYLVPMPPEYRESEPLAGIYTRVSVVGWSDTLLLGFQGLNELRLMRTDGTMIDSVSIPVRRRRGVSPDIGAQIMGLSFPEMFSLSSALFALYRLESGDFAAIHYDQEIVESHISSRVFVSLLSSDLDRACVDKLLPNPDETQVRTTMRGDTLFVLQQEVEGTKARTVIKEYLISDIGCAWISTASGREADG
ncbi:MAG: hypothetical protein ACRENI_14015, partial [Gemmatimonadaceae bacterium]